MAELEVNKALYRPLKSGVQFEGLIPPFHNENRILEKNNKQSDVFDTLNYMAYVSKKDGWQMNKVAPLLKGQTEAETIYNVFRFVHDHYQYKIDTDKEPQRLFSPSAAWHFRRTGFDCKVFSITTSAILSCLNITHAFRMVKQKGVRSQINPNEWIINPNYWSHVYVIVPTKNNKYYVIDATTHDNKEVQFIDKNDKIMQHQYLNAPSTYGNQQRLGCACSGNKLGATVAESNGLTTAIANFHLFLNELEKQGVSRQVTSKILELVKYNVQNGIDPNFNEILHKALYTQGSLNGVLDVVPGLSNISVGGVSASNAIGIIAGDPTAIMAVATKIIPLDKIQSGFMSIFANGFNVTCFGSTYTPTQTKDWASTDFPLIYDATLGKGLTQQNLNDFIDVMLHVKHKMDDNGHGMASCSQKAMFNYGDAALAMLNMVIDKIKTYATLTQVESINIQGKTFPQYKFQMPDCYEPWTSSATSWRFTLKVIPPTITQNTNGTVTITQPDGTSKTITNALFNAGNVTNVTSDGTKENPPAKPVAPTPDKQKDYTIPIVVGLGILAKLTLF